MIEKPNTRKGSSETFTEDPVQQRPMKPAVIADTQVLHTALPPVMRVFFASFSE